MTKLILRPINMFSFWFSRDLADKSLNLFFTLLEISLMLVIFKFPFYFPQKLETVGLFLLMAFIAIFLYYFINFTLSIVAFWTEEIWATRWLFGIIFLEFFAGAFFPIDVLPMWLQKVIYLTPFPYLVFFPLKIWLEQLSRMMIIRAILVCSVWLVTFNWLARFLWQKGAKNYGAYGG